MKSRRLVRDMCEYMGAVNPGLAKALIGGCPAIASDMFVRPVNWGWPRR